MLKGYLGSLIGGVKTVGRTGGGNHRHGAFTVTSVESLQQVGLLALGGKACRRSAALHVNDDQRQLVDDGKVDCLRLKTYSRARCRCGSQRTCKRRADGTCTTRNLILTLYGNHAARLVLRQLVEYVGGRSDRIRAKEQAEACLLSGCYKSVRRGFVARDVHIASLLL